MPFIPNTDQDRQLMLRQIGVDKFDNLLKPVPENLCLKGPLGLPRPLGELELTNEIKNISSANRSDISIFAGGGVYDHFIPAALENLLSRPEFVTAYTPYQAEVSQGTLQLIYEFQTHICRLTDMYAANASMYDGASAAAEAALLSLGATQRSKILISETVSPLFINVIRTYLSGHEVEIVVVPHKNGVSDFDHIKDSLDDKTACLLLAQPNFFGQIEDIEVGAELIHKMGGHLVVSIDPIAAAILKTPGESGADIVVGEGQPLGLPLNFGGPLLGFFAVTKELIRRLPGRLAARTVDEDGKEGFVLTLQTREQHIRRDRATSNICTNQALCATAVTIYLSLMGRQGLRQAALLSLEKAHQAAEKIFAIPGFESCFEGDFVREFAVRTPIPARDLIEKMIDDFAILPGIDMGRYFAGMDNVLLLALTEKRTVEEIEALSMALEEYSTNVVLSEL